MKKSQPGSHSPIQLFGIKVRDLVIGVIMLILLVWVGAVLWQRWTTVVDTSDYEGKIVDRWADYVESQQGSHPRLRLLVETKDGKRITVKVEPGVYESARVGMRIKSKDGQIVLIESEPKSIVDK
jgi:hypothetical protein